MVHKNVQAKEIIPLMDCSRRNVVLPSMGQSNVCYVVEYHEFVSCIRAYMLGCTWFKRHSLFVGLEKANSPSLPVAFQQEIGILQVYECVKSWELGVKPSLYSYDFEGSKDMLFERFRNFYEKIPLDSRLKALRKISAETGLQSSIALTGEHYWKYEYGIALVACSMFDSPILFNLK